MVEIRVDTEFVRTAGRRFLNESAEIEEIGQTLNHAINSLDTWSWDGRSRADAEPLLRQVRPQSNALAGELERLGRLLRQVADYFEGEDATAARALEGMPWIEGLRSSGLAAAAASLSSVLPSSLRIIRLFPPWSRDFHWIRPPWHWWRPYPWPPRYWPIVPVHPILPIRPPIFRFPWRWPRPGIPRPILPPRLLPGPIVPRRPLPRPFSPGDIAYITTA